MTAIQTLLVEIMKDVGAVKKDSRNAAQGFVFRGIDAVVNAVHPALVKHGVVVYPSVKHVEYATLTSNKGAEMTSVRGVVEYVFIGPDGDSLVASAAAEAFDSGDKATAKFMSVAFRTVLLQTLSLPTDEPDPDATTYERGPSLENQIVALKVRIQQARRKAGLPVDKAAILAAITEHVGREDTADNPWKLPEYADYLDSLTGTTGQEQVDRALGGGA